jgi:flagella basal body P-ring formation protein FlgA
MSMALIIAFWTSFIPLPVEVDRIQRAVEDYVYTTTGASRTELVVEIRGRIPRLAVSSRDYSIRVAPTTVSSFKGYVTIPIEIVCQGRIEQTTSVSVRIRRFGPVLMTSRLLSKNHDMVTEDVIRQHVETTTLPEDILSELSEIEGQRTVRIVSGNCVLTRSMMECSPIVLHDDHVILAVRSNKAIVTVQGIAKQDGRIGDVITVQKTGSHEQYRGKVVGAHAVEICLEESASIFHASHKVRGRK